MKEIILGAMYLAQYQKGLRKDLNLPEAFLQELSCIKEGVLEDYRVDFFVMLDTVQSTDFFIEYIVNPLGLFYQRSENPLDTWLTISFGSKDSAELVILGLKDLCEGYESSRSKLPFTVTDIKNIKLESGALSAKYSYVGGNFLGISDEAISFKKDREAIKKNRSYCMDVIRKCFALSKVFQECVEPENVVDLIKTAFSDPAEICSFNWVFNKLIGDVEQYSEVKLNLAEKIQLLKFMTFTLECYMGVNSSEVTYEERRKKWLS